MFKIDTNYVKKIKKIISDNTFKIEDLSDAQVEALIKNSELMGILDKIYDKNDIIDVDDINTLESDLRRISMAYFKIKNIELFDQTDALRFEEELEKEFDYYEDDYDNCSTNQTRDYMLSIRKIPILTYDEAKYLFEKYHEGDMDARKKIIEANLKLVVSVAKHYVRSDQSDLFMDVVNEGNIGLMKAVEKFNPDRGYMFSTYAIWWIRQSINRTLPDRSRNIRIPSYMNENIKKIRRTEVRLTNELNRQPTYKEIGDCLGFSEDRVREIIRITQEPVSLDNYINNDDESEDSVLMDFVKDDKQNVETEVFEKELRKIVKEMLSVFKERDRKIIELRFGLVDGKRRTLEEVGQEFGVTRERIRQIEKTTLKKLRLKQRSDILRNFID